MSTLLILSLAPVAIIAFYIYNRDLYDKEPAKLLLRGLLWGALVCFPASSIEKFLVQFNSSPFYEAFVVAGFTEEMLKYLALYFLIWKNEEFNEKFDGIVYGVYVALGFAGLENILYVMEGGLGTAITRAVTAVPAHAIFGLTMGYYFGMAKFDETNRTSYIIKSIIFPIILHGLYDYCLMTSYTWLTALFIPYVIFLWIHAFKKLKSVEQAPLDENEDEDDNYNYRGQKWIIKP